MVIFFVISGDFVVLFGLFFRDAVLLPKGLDSTGAGKAACPRRALRCGVTLYPASVCALLLINLQETVMIYKAEEKQTTDPTRQLSACRA